MTMDEDKALTLEALKYAASKGHGRIVREIKIAPFTIKEALAQPEFIKHEVENADDWSEWVCPDPKNYFLKCCDCGLVHEAQFGVVRYKSETERDDCDVVDDPNLQAVFRMRRSEERSEEWTADDTAHRSGGLPMAQPEQKPVAWMSDQDVGFKKSEFGATPTVPLYTTPPYTFARAIEAAIKDNKP